MERIYKKVVVSKKGEDSILRSHPWIYVSDLKSRDNGITNGDLVDVYSEKDKYLGTGFYNDNSKIIVRLLSRNANDKFDKEFFKRRIKYALDYRLNTIYDTNSFRLIYGESDELPGLTVDKFNDIIVCQILSLGIEVRKDDILNSIYEVMTENGFEINGIYLRNDVDIRLKEGMEMYKDWFLNKNNHDTKTVITENGINYLVDFLDGQKTGFFLDQKYNRLLVRNLAKDKNVLDCCTHTGSFSMNAVLGGAKKVTALDISEKAIQDAKYNFSLNDMEYRIDTITDDVFNTLQNIKKGEYDFIILDPPAFTKSRETVSHALSGYEEINYLAMKKLNRGGYLATASCSHFAEPKLFKEAIFKASLKANVKLKLISYTGPSPDHPELLGVPETNYLKFFIFQVF